MFRSQGKHQLPRRGYDFYDPASSGCLIDTLIGLREYPQIWIGRRGRYQINILTVNLLLSTFVFWVAARLYLIPRLSSFEPRTIIAPILLLHATRHFGLMFLAPGATYPGLSPHFAVPAAVGDLVAAILALAALPAVMRRARSAKPLVWVFNVWGSVDLLAAISLATYFDAAPYMGAAYWIPAFWVPALLVTHYLTFRVLRQPWSRITED